MSLGGIPAISPELKSRLRFTSTHHEPIPGVLLFSDVGQSPVPIRANQCLCSRIDANYQQDDFLHEQHMLISESGRSILLVGCAHSGIIPIIEKCVALSGHLPDVVIGGFHLYSPGSGTEEPPERIREVGQRLAQWPCIYYSGHCTGQAAYEQLQTYLGTRLRPMHTGIHVEI